MEKTRDQRLANESWGVLTNRFGKDSAEWKNNEHAAKYLAALRKTTNRVYNSGPGLALAFLEAKGNDDKRKALKWAAEDLAKLINAAPGMPNEPAAPGAPAVRAAVALIATIRSNNVRVLMQVTEEMLGAITWLTRYLEGEDVMPAVDEEGDADG